MGLYAVVGGMGFIAFMTSATMFVLHAHEAWEYALWFVICVLAFGLMVVAGALAIEEALGPPGFPS